MKLCSKWDDFYKTNHVQTIERNLLLSNQNQSTPDIGEEKLQDLIPFSSDPKDVCQS